MFLQYPYLFLSPLHKYKAFTHNTLFPPPLQSRWLWYTVDHSKQRISKRIMSTDMSDYTDIKEEEAEILMHAKNEVFYNKTQVLFL